MELTQEQQNKLNETTMTIDVRLAELQLIRNTLSNLPISTGATELVRRLGTILDIKVKDVLSEEKAEPKEEKAE